VAVDQEATSGMDRSLPHDAFPPPSKRGRLPLSAPTAPLSTPPPCMSDAAYTPPPSVAMPAVNLVKDCLCTSCASAWLEANRARQGEQAALRASSEADTRARHLKMQMQTSARHLHPTPALDVDAAPPLTSPVVQADAVPSCQAFLDYLISDGVERSPHEPILMRIASAILLNGNKDRIYLQHRNGRSQVYLREVSPQKVSVRKSQRNKRKAAVRRQLVTAGSMPVAGDAFSGSAGGLRKENALSVREQVGLVFELGLSWSTFSKIRRALGGRKSGLASRHVLHAAKREMAASAAKSVVVTHTGAHLTDVALAVQEQVTALCDNGKFVERFVYGPDGKPLRAEDAMGLSALTPGLGVAAPPPPSPTSSLLSAWTRGATRLLRRLWSPS